MSEHTPGQWRTDERNGAVSGLSYSGTWKWICQNIHGGTPDERMANMNLIAAAPDLLEALENLSGGFLGEAIAVFENWNSEKAAVLRAYRASALKALTKAKGATTTPLTSQGKGCVAEPGTPTG